MKGLQAKQQITHSQD